ncbi:hypothetical protein IT397_02785, partial [Candidatus Nomurabacteria bacterium]|nr:hypothetical protein [Candidatus Nomurabacteria bacterium]
MIYLEIGFIILIVVLQLYTFFDVRGKMKDLSSFFPSNFDLIKIENYILDNEAIQNSDKFRRFIETISEDDKEADGFPESKNTKNSVDLLVLPNNLRIEHPLFNEVINSTNAYLCKNKGASADFSILQDTCERQIQRLDNSISNLINVPLYIGLAGTFVGIIIGLWGIDFTTETGAIDSSSISQL